MAGGKAGNKLRGEMMRWQRYGYKNCKLSENGRRPESPEAPGRPFQAIEVRDGYDGWVFQNSGTESKSGEAGRIVWEGE